MTTSVAEVTQPSNTFSFSPHLWTPQLRGLLQSIRYLQQGESVCLYGPTGSGKTTMAEQLMQWADHQGIPSTFYVNRKLLIAQTYNRFAQTLNVGVRAADFDDAYDLNAMHQIASADTERARVLDKKRWGFHPAGLVIVDEAHIQRTDTMRTILDYYRRRGAMIVALTATPIGLSQWYDRLIVSGTLQEYRACNALVPAIVYGIEQPDLKKVKRDPSGDYVLDGRVRKIFTQSIVGSVIDRWKEYNPYARPAMLFAPGKDESVWFTEQFESIGVPWAHVDATEAVLHGKRYKLTRKLWEDILGKYKDGTIKGLSSRFKLREGVDLPMTYHAILATPIGSLASYIQTVGRVLRYSPETPDNVIITDHGGNYLRQGSPNSDRPWSKFWAMPEGAISDFHLNNIRDGKIPEPICCPSCRRERKSGITCPHCGHTHAKGKRHVIQENGKLVTYDGKMIPKRRITTKPDTERQWAKMYHGFKRNPSNNQTFAQMYGFFAHENGYFPPKNLPFMPREDIHWYTRVKDCKACDLHTTESSREAQK